MKYENSMEFARQMDRDDPLRKFRDRFHHPMLNGQQALYFTGNSLGLMTTSTRDALDVELDVWAARGVEGHFEGDKPWYNYHEYLAPMLAEIVGASESEVVCMNSLTVNLHLLFWSFYRPEGKRFKIISESKMFPSDHYMLETQVRSHGLDPEQAIIEVEPREGEFLLRTEDIVSTIEANRDELALVFFGGVNYYTGQLYDMPALTRAAHAAGAMAGFDLAHAAGNLPLELHDWDVDFAAWCSYKYLNAGPGNAGGIYVHEKHARRTDIPRMGGWWGHDKDDRFLMEPGFRPMPGAEGWQLSCPAVLGMAAQKAALEVFCEAGLPALRKKSILLTGFLEFVLSEIFEASPRVVLKIITPTDPAERGAQLSVKLVGTDKSFFDAMMADGILGDFRAPDVVRLAPVPLYNSFEDIYLTGRKMAKLLEPVNTA
jgi:kynureninase